MIIDLPRFIESERPVWNELEKILDHMAADAKYRMDLEKTQRFHYLYQRVLSDLARVATFSSEPEIRHYLESLTARAYEEMNEVRDRELRFTPVKWFVAGFPQVFRRHVRFFWLSFWIILLGGIFAAGVLAVDPGAKEILIPAQFGHLYQTPSQRVKNEESAKSDRLEGMHGRFSTSLMTHNTQVAILTFGLGITYGVGTLVFLFYNGVILGAVVYDYVQAGQGTFLLGWLLPHGVIEIPAILIGGQAGFLLAYALIGWGDRRSLRDRLRFVRKDLALLVYGAAIMLVWAGLVESFLSQHHQPVIPYSSKIIFGLLELMMLAWFLAVSGRKEPGQK